MNKANALLSLRPGAEWVLRGDDLEWLDQNQTQPTNAEIQAEVARLQAEYDAKAYQRSRAAEYPDFKDYLDGIVKGDQAQIDAYIAACQAVKAKYPKPSE
jgi:tRNA A37 N6-isopentenylltransferase MiaA